MRKLVASAVLAAVLGVPAWAAVKTVRLSVPGMTCPACPITVKMALAKVAGVRKVLVNYPKREALVTYEDSITTVKALTEATANVGYPSKADH